MSSTSTDFSLPAGPSGNFRPSTSTSSVDQDSLTAPKQRRFKSARLIGEYEKPWVAEAIYKRRETWDKVIFYGCISLGMVLGGVYCYFLYAAVPKHDYCLMYSEDFQSPNWRDNWVFEQQIGGFGVGSFEWTTDDPLNAYADAGGLHIVATETTATTNITVDQMLNGYTLNLTESGSCTAKANAFANCNATSNATTQTIINPYRSARLTTQGKHSIRYGRVEVTAKLPKGDWLWPAIWMLPEDSVYGEWPLSGEIDIMEARGNSNNYTFSSGGRFSFSSAFHWGLSFLTDQFRYSLQTTKLRRGDYSEAYHTYGLEWSEDYMFIYLDNRLAVSLYMSFSERLGTLWKRGDFGHLYGYKDAADPWSQTGRYNTPFDQPFYLILNVAIGGTGGFFPDGLGGKPWIDGNQAAALEFWNAKDSYLPTWDKEGFQIKDVKMWQQGKCGTS